MKNVEEHNKEQLEMRPKAEVVCGEKGCKGQLRFLREDGDSLLRSVVCPVCMKVTSMYFAPKAKAAPESPKA